MSGIGKTMKEFAAGKLRSSSGDLVTDRAQAVAIGLSQEREARKQKRKSKYTAGDAARALVSKGESDAE